MSRSALALSLALLSIALATPLFAAEPKQGDAEVWPSEVKQLVAAVESPDSLARSDAIQKLRLLARRVDRSGGQRLQCGGVFDPQVKGLVPVLIRAAADKDESNRLLAVYALADTRDPEAVAALRARLRDDPSQMVRFNAACLLTEFSDVSGLDELKAALARLRARPDAAHMFDIEKLLASLERATGKSFGEIPMNPVLSSDARAAETATAKYITLLDHWTAWWEWTPGGK